MNIMHDLRMDVRIINGFPALCLDGAPYPPVAYASYLPSDKLYAGIAAAGIHLYCFPAYLGDRGINIHSGIGPFRSPVWLDENEFDFGSIERDFKLLMGADPSAIVLLRIHLDAPSWWEKQHSGGCCMLPDGTTLRQCFSSPEWLNATDAALRTCIRWCLASPFASRLAGIHIGAGGTEEWVYHYHGEFHDCNPARAAAFKEWLKSRYGDTASLRVAWGMPDVSLETAEPACVAAPGRSGGPFAERAVVDTFRFNADTLANAICRFCRSVKDESCGRLLTGVFYGYHYYLHDPRKGHGALSKVLDCEAVDYLASPNAYWRKPGEDWPPMAPVQSVQLHGKLWMAENDTRTCRTTFLRDVAPGICPAGGWYDGGVWAGPSDMRTSVALLWNNAARMLAYGYGGWWFDMWGGWFDAPELMEVLEKVQRLAARYPPQLNREMAPEVCVVMDEDLPHHDPSFGNMCRPVSGNAMALGRSGSPYALYLRSDLPTLAIDSFKAVWLLGFAVLRKAESDILSRFARKANALLLWTDISGVHKRAAKRGAWEECCGAGPIASHDLCSLWKRSGVHVYCDQGDVLYAGCGWLSLHTVDGGARRIRLPFPASVLDVVQDKIVAEKAADFDVRLMPMSTTIFRIER